MPRLNGLGYWDPYDFTDSDTSDEGQEVDRDDDAESYHSFRTRSSGPNSSVPSVVSFKPMSEGSIPSSFTSYDRDSQRSSSEGSRSASPASLITLSESIRERFFREEHGRRMNNYSEVYRLPADEEEWARLGVYVQFQFASFGLKLVTRSATLHFEGNYGRKIPT
jgi:hypothetical protein